VPCRLVCRLASGTLQLVIIQAGLFLVLLTCSLSLGVSMLRYGNVRPAMFSKNQKLYNDNVKVKLEREGCGLCVDAHAASFHCVQCQIGMCTFQSTVHRATRSTADHQLTECGSQTDMLIAEQMRSQAVSRAAKLATASRNLSLARTNVTAAKEQTAVHIHNYFDEVRSAPKNTFPFCDMLIDVVMFVFDSSLSFYLLLSSCFPPSFFYCHFLSLSPPITVTHGLVLS
jgi:hypothetical protein